MCIDIIWLYGCVIVPKLYPWIIFPWLYDGCNISSWFYYGCITFIWIYYGCKIFIKLPSSAIDLFLTCGILYGVLLFKDLNFLTSSWLSATAAIPVFARILSDFLSAMVVVMDDDVSTGRI